MLQLKRTQKTEDGQEVKHQNHFCCTTTCGHCRKKRHYRDECHIKCSESEKLKKAEPQVSNGVRTPVRVVDLKGGAQTLEVLRVRVSLVEDEGPQRPPLVEEQHPTPHLRRSHRVEKQSAPSTPSFGGADNSSENAKKRHRNWHSKCLQAAGFEVKFPEEG